MGWCNGRLAVWGGMAGTAGRGGVRGGGRGTCVGMWVAAWDSAVGKARSGCVGGLDWVGSGGVGVWVWVRLDGVGWSVSESREGRRRKGKGGRALEAGRVG